MPLKFTSPVTTQLTVNSSEAQGFSVNNKSGIIDIQYLDGNMDVNNVFTPIGDMKNLHIEGANFNAVLVANPTLYPLLKTVINNLIAQHKGTPGTII